MRDADSEKLDNRTDAQRRRMVFLDVTCVMSNANMGGYNATLERVGESWRAMATTSWKCRT